MKKILFAAALAGAAILTACGDKGGGVRMGSLSEFDSLSYVLGANIGNGINFEMRDIPFDFKAIDKGIKESAMGKATQEHDKSLEMLREYFMTKRGERAQAIAAKRAEQDSIRLAGGDSTKVEYPTADPAMFENEEERAEISYAFGNDIGYNISQSGMPIQLVWIGQAMQDVRDGKAKMTEDEVRVICGHMLTKIPQAITEALALNDRIYDAASKLVAAEHVFYIGRDIDWALCTEASLKLKEISYIHSESYAAGELKHGTISLITEGTPVIALTTVSKVCEKTISGIREVKSRGAYVISVCSKELAGQYDIPCDEQIVIPQIDELLLSFPAVTILQLLAYHVSALKGLDVDKPRNLAKSVTVE